LSLPQAGALSGLKEGAGSQSRSCAGAHLDAKNGLDRCFAPERPRFDRRLPQRQGREADMNLSVWLTIASAVLATAGFALAALAPPS
jgi:hypothetical protein